MTNSHETGARPGRPLLLLPVQTAVVAALGLLVSGPLAHRWPLSAEDGVNRTLAAHRTPFATALTDGVSLLAGTESVIALSLLCTAALLLVPRVPRWREAAFLAAAVAAQSAVFLLVTLVVDRPRPDVPHLDPAPPTSSFPSVTSGPPSPSSGGWPSSRPGVCTAFGDTSWWGCSSWSRCSWRSPGCTAACTTPPTWWRDC